MMIKFFRFLLKSKKQDEKVCTIKKEMDVETNKVNTKLKQVNTLLRGVKSITVH